MTDTISGIFTSLRTAWQDLMPMGEGMSFTTQEFLEERVSELERENRQLRELLSGSEVEVSGHRCGAAGA